MQIPEYYILNAPQHRWGDYGDLLVHGMAHREVRGGYLQLQRTGPYVPPISFPGIGEMVVTDRVRREMNQFGLRGFGFEPVDKKLIVASDWHDWPAETDAPQAHPETGEPENYVLGQPHSAEAADEMGDLWALSFNHGAETRRDRRIVKRRSEIKLVAASVGDRDLFAAQGVGFIYASPSAKQWLEDRFADAVTFEPATVVAD